MSVREMGPYVLLHKLSEDALSETYRAGLKSGDDVERVVLVCFFKAAQEDVDWIAETASVGRRALTGLASPQLADIVDSGEVAGTAFLAYDYISGVSLSTLMETSQREGIHVPLELAILIANGTAKGLLAAWQHESRMLHGFLVPPLVLVSSEGEVRLLGFEVASRLRRLLKDDQLRDELGPYLAPEVVPEGQPATTDDVYSLGAMLFELATGTPPPIDPVDLEEAVATATLADGSELPEEIRDLLAAGLAPTMRRSNLKDWSENLSRIVLSGRYEATSFNLAFFLHRLFGDELDDEAGQPAASHDVSADLLASAVVALQDEAAVPDTRGEERQPGESSDEEPSWEEDRPSEVEDAIAFESPDPSTARRKRFAVAASIVAFVLAAASTAYFVSATPDSASSQTAVLTAPVSGSPSGQPPLTQPPLTMPPLTMPRAQPEAEPVTLDPDVDTSGQEESAPKTPEPKAPQKKATTKPAQPTVVEIDQRVQELASQQSIAMEASLRSPYQGEIDQLRPQLEEAQQAPVGAIETEDVEPAPVVTAAEQPATETGPGGFDAELAGSEVLDDPSTPQADLMATAEPTQTEHAEAETTRQEALTIPAVGAQQPPTEPPAAPSPSTQLGDLVSPGPGVKPPKLLESVQLVYPLMARRLHREAIVALRVLVDETGSVIQIEQLGKAAGLGFDEAAIKATRGMTWQPASKDGVRVKIWWTVRLEFKL